MYNFFSQLLILLFLCVYFPNVCNLIVNFETLMPIKPLSLNENCLMMLSGFTPISSLAQLNHVIAALVQSAVDTKTSLSNHNVTTVNRHAPNFLVASFARRLVSNSIEKNSEHLQEESLNFYYYYCCKMSNCDSCWITGALKNNI